VVWIKRWSFEKGVRMKVENRVILFEGLPVEVSCLIDKWRRIMVFEDKIKRIEEMLEMPRMISNPDSVNLYFITKKWLFWYKGGNEPVLYRIVKRKVPRPARESIMMMEYLNDLEN
jgi:hypothetical protein